MAFNSETHSHTGRNYITWLTLLCGKQAAADLNFDYAAIHSPRPLGYVRIICNYRLPYHAACNAICAMQPTSIIARPFVSQLNTTCPKYKNGKDLHLSSHLSKDPSNFLAPSCKLETGEASLPHTHQPWSLVFQTDLVRQDPSARWLSLRSTGETDLMTLVSVFPIPYIREDGKAYFQLESSRKRTQYLPL